MAMRAAFLAALVFSLALAGCAGTPPPSNLDVTQASASPLVQAAIGGDVDQVQSLASSGASLNVVTAQGTPLTAAAANGHDRVAWFLLKQGANPNLQDGNGVTPLIAAAAEGSQRLVKLLLSAGADVNASGGSGQTPVGAAAEAGNLSVVKTLLGAGGNVNIAPDGKSLLMHVVDNGDLLTAEVLIAAGADATYRAEDGTTALDIARAKRYRDLEMLLVQAGAER
ncbi:ankyrin repeat domain-containing protein [Marinobacter sp. V034]|uniref:ankyrin repeat domain-containing protein n=1 Tax=Marinobacter sp. V034 TaxID=3459610 RepID=UPI0040442F3B